jgi:hypothetical protein
VFRLKNTTGFEHTVTAGQGLTFAEKRLVSLCLDRPSFLSEKNRPGERKHRDLSIDHNSVDGLSGLPVTEILANHTWRYLIPGERIRVSDLTWDSAQASFVAIEECELRNEVLVYDAFARRNRLATGLYRWLDRGELVRGGDQWRFCGEWRSCFASAGRRVETDHHMLRRVDGQADNTCQIACAGQQDAAARLELAGFASAKPSLH